MLSTAPQPHLTDVFGLLSVQADPATLANSWTGEEDLPTFWFSRSAWALWALAQGFSLIRKRPPRIWVPAYFCNQSLAPLRLTEPQLSFYPVTADAEPDWPACKAMAEQAAPDFFLIVHTFGKINDLPGARDFCARYGAALVEDAAHVLVPYDDMGKQSACIFYSPYKLIGIPDGGVLVARDHELAEMMHRAEAIASDKMPSSQTWLLKRLAQACIPEPVLKVLKSEKTTSFDWDPPLTAPSDTPVMSATARRLLVRNLPRLQAVAERRREANKRLQDILLNLSEWQPFVTEWGEGVPYRTVMRCSSHDVAARYFNAITRNGGLVESWPDLPPEVTAAPAGNEAALALRKTLLLFPIDAGLTPEKTATMFRKILGKSNGML